MSDSVAEFYKMLTEQKITHILVVHISGTLGTREDSVISASGTLGTREDSVVSASGTLGTREDSHFRSWFPRDSRGLKSFQLLVP